MNKSVRGFVENIEKISLENNNFRKVLYTSEYLQIVLMNLLPKQEIGMEIHENNDQFFRVESGEGKCIINDNSYDIEDGTGIIVPAGAKHNIINTSSKKDLKVYTIYSPPHHKDKIVRATKKEAETKEAEFDGKTSE